MEQNIKNHYLAAKKLASLLDDRFEIFGIKFGLDPLLEAVPVLGNFIANAVGAFIVYVAWEMGVPANKIIKMVANIAADLIIGAVPVIGDVGTIFFRSNRNNIKILDEFVASKNMVVEEGEIVG